MVADGKNTKGIKIRLLSPVTFLGSLVLSLSLLVFLILTEKALQRVSLEEHLRLAGQSLRTAESVLKETLLRLDVELQKVANSTALLKKIAVGDSAGIDFELLQLYEQGNGALFDVYFASDMGGEVLADVGLLSGGAKAVATMLASTPLSKKYHWQLLNLELDNGSVSPLMLYRSMLGETHILYAGLLLNGHDLLFTQIERQSGVRCAVLLQGEAVLARSSLDQQCDGVEPLFKPLIRWQREYLNEGSIVIRGAFPGVLQGAKLDLGLLLADSAFPVEVENLFDRSLTWLAMLMLLNIAFLVFLYWLTSLSVRRVLRYADRLTSHQPTPAPKIHVHELDIICSSLGHMSNAFDREMLTRLEAESRLVEKERMSTLGEVAAIIAHELRNPLSTVSNSLNMLCKLRLVEGNVQGERVIERARRNVDRCSNIITDLFRYSRAGTQNLECLVLNSCLLSALDEFSASSGVPVINKIDPTVCVLAENEKLEVVASNLLVNAHQAAIDSNMDRQLKLEVETISEGEWSTLLIKDNGPGMDGKTLARASDPLFSTKQYGVGLGLGIVQRVMRDFGGDFELQSRVGEGTVARLRLKRCTLEMKS